MSDLNPYQSPSSPVGEWKDQPAAESAFFDAMQALAQTKPWVRLLSVLGFLVFGFSVIGMVFVLGFTPGGPVTLMMVVTIPISLLFYFMPSLLLWNYASRIGNFLNDRSSNSLAAAVAAQKSFWKYVGILVAVILVFYLGVLLLGGIATIL